MEKEPEFKPNSDTKKREGRPVEKVVTGSVSRREKPLTRKLTDNLISEEAPNVGSYILFDVMIPAFKSMLSDMIVGGSDQILFGGGSRRSSGRSGRSSSRADYISYNRASDRPEKGGREMSRAGRAIHDFDEIKFDMRGDAEIVLERMSDLISDYGMATVSDLYDFCGMTGEYTDDRWGWTSSRAFTVVRTRGGYILDLPKPSPIK